MPESRIAENIIHIEGMDLAGKSTATDALRRLHPGAELRRNALVTDNEIFQFADRLRKAASQPAEVLGHLYIAAAKHDIATFCPPATPTIQDSTIIIRSLAFYSVLGDEAIVAEFIRLLGCHPRFGRSIVLTASIDARIDRLKQRMRMNPHEVAPDDLAIITAPEQFLAMERVLVEIATRDFGAVVIDTSNLSRADVVDAVLVACEIDH